MRTFALLGAVNAFVAVAAGAFAAHALKKRLDPEMFGIFEVGARYHMYHALGLFVAAWLAARGAPAAMWGGWAMQAGIVLFSGSLYALALSGVRGLGAITPIGGLGFLVGWALLAWSTISIAKN